jgi:hypothetical protein
MLSQQLPAILINKKIKENYKKHKSAPPPPPKSKTVYVGNKAKCVYPSKKKRKRRKWTSFSNKVCLKQF